MYQVRGKGSLEGLNENVERPLSEVRSFEVALPDDQICVVTFLSDRMQVLTPDGVEISMSYTTQVNICFFDGEISIRRSR